MCKGRHDVRVKAKTIYIYTKSTQICVLFNLWNAWDAWCSYAKNSIALYGLIQNVCVWAVCECVENIWWTFSWNSCHFDQFLSDFLFQVHFFWFFFSHCAIYRYMYERMLETEWVVCVYLGVLFLFIQIFFVFVASKTFISPTYMLKM